MAKTNQTAKAPKRLSGAVLIMVVTVMFVLIIMLLATLTVVSTAQNRAYTKYEENQAYYTARSALDVFTESMISDSSYYAQTASNSNRKYYYLDESGAQQSADMKQGLAMELELYKITAQNSATNPFANPVVGDGTFTNAIDEAYYTVDTTGIDSITYTVTLPTYSGTDDYGRLADDNTATIKVEVLERRFNMNTTYTDAELAAATATSTPSISDIKAAIAGGNRSKDFMKVKVTSTVEYMGIEGTASLIFNTYEKIQNSNKKAVTSLSELSQSSGIYPIGGGSSLMGDFKTAMDSVISGSIFVTGSFTNASNMTILMQPDTHIVALKDINFTNVLPKIDGAGGFMYSYGKIYIDVAQDLGDSTNKVNVITKEFLFGGNPPRVYGNVFAEKLDIRADGNGNGRIYGEAYVNDLVLHPNFISFDDTNGTATFDARLTNFFDLNSPTGGKINIANEIIVNSTPYRYDSTTSKLINQNDPTKSYAVTLPANLTFDSAKAIKVDYFDGTQYTVNAQHEKVFTLPGNMCGSSPTNTVEIPTIRSLYSDYFEDTKFVEESATPGHGGDFNFVSIADLQDISKKSANQASIIANIKTAKDKYGSALDPYTSADVVSTTAPIAGDPDVPSGYSVISSSGVLESKNYGNIVIDARSSNIVLQLGDGSNPWFTLEGRFLVVGQKEVTFLLPDGCQYNFGDTSGRACVIASEKLVDKLTFSSASFNGGNSTVTLSLGTGGTSPAPNVNVYAGLNSKISLGTQSFLTGYVYAPNSSFELAGGANGYKHNINYSGYTFGSSVGVNVIGSIVCLDYTSNQKVGVAFIPNDRNGYIQGDPKFNWNPYMYTRN